MGRTKGQSACFMQCRPQCLIEHASPLVKVGVLAFIVWKLELWLACAASVSLPERPSKKHFVLHYYDVVCLQSGPLPDMRHVLTWSKNWRHDNLHAIRASATQERKI